MPHYYVSIQTLDHKVFKYAGYVLPVNKDYYRKAFEQHGPTGLPHQHNPEPDPCKVLAFDEYAGDRITADGEPYGEQPYTPKQLIMTRRESPTQVLRLMWTQKSSPKEESDGLTYALEEGWILHAFQVGDNNAWEHALAQHKEIESSQVEAIKDKVAKWLQSQPDTTDVEPVTLTIGKQAWEGARYTQGGQVHYYLIGEQPTSHHKGYVCYRMPDDDRDWFVACYLDKTRLATAPKQYHPFRLNWIMMPWTTPEKIDDFWCNERCHRMKVTVK